MPGRALRAALSIPGLVSILAVAACGSSVVPSNPPAEPSASAAPVPLDPASCAVRTPVGPADQVPSGAGDSFNTADAGNGRWRLCLQTPTAVSLEGSATCTWNPARTEVIEVDGLPLETERGIALEGGARIGDGADVFLQRVTSNGGDQQFATYESADPQPVRAVSGGRSGIGAFDLKLSQDPETTVAGSPPRLTGLIGWTCGVPPRPEAGRSTGLVSLRLDRPVGLQWQLKAECDWASAGKDDRLTLVQTDSSDIHVADRTVAIAIEPDVTDPDAAVANLFVDTGEEGGAYQDHGGLISTEQAADGRTGTLRLRHLTIDRGLDVRIVDDVTDVSGIVRWVCPPPVVRGPRVQEHRPIRRPEIAGNATVTFSPPVAAPATGQVRCTLGRINRNEVQVTEVRGRLVTGDRTIVLRTFGGSVIVGVIGADRQPAGEYVGQAAQLADDAAHPPLLIDVPSLAFEPTDPFYVPLAGPAGPRTIGVRIDYSCDLSAL